MNENQLRLLLNQGTPVRPEIAERLRHARERALERQQPEAAPALAWAGGVVGELGGWSGLALRVLLPLALLLGTGLTLYTWQQNRFAADVEEIDALLLTDDLPLDAYLDRGFQNWLRKQAQE